MKDNSTGNIKVTYYSNCVGDGPLRQTNKCNGLRVGSQVKFTGKYISSLILQKCLMSFVQKFKISPEKIDLMAIAPLYVVPDQTFI